MVAERLHANEPRVVHETIDGEVIVIDLATGNYFSLQGGAADVWALIISGQPTGDMVSALADAYGEAPDTIRAALDPFLAELKAESLVSVATTGEVNNSRMPELKAAATFSASLDKHTDMTELILLDPVHDVDSLGWPHVPEGQETQGSKAS